MYILFEIPFQCCNWGEHCSLSNWREVQEKRCSIFRSQVPIRNNWERKFHGNWKSMASTQALSPQQQRPMTLVGPYGIELGSSNFHISSSSSTPKQLEATISQTLQPVCNNALWPMSALMDCTVLSWREGTFTFAEGNSKTKQSSTYGTKIFFSSEPIEISSKRKKKLQNLSSKKATIQW